MEDDLSNKLKCLIKIADSAPLPSASVEHSAQLQSSTAKELTTAELEKKLKDQQQALQQAYEELNIERDFIRATMKSLHEGVIVTDLDGVIYYTNPAIDDLLKTQPKANTNKSINDILILKTDESLPIELTNINNTTIETDLQVAFIEQEDGSKSTIEWSRTFITNKEAERLGLVFTINDITTAYNLNNQLKHQASHDTLTGLLNRREFDRRLLNCLTGTQEANIRHSLIFIDLDQFKTVNDSCGHLAGDQLLRQLSSIMSPLVRGRDTLARLGGDEFAILLEACPKNAALKVANEVLSTIQKFRFTCDNKTFNIGASMGIAHFSSGPQTENDPLIVADAACYKAKEEGRNCIIEMDISNVQHPPDIPQHHIQWVNRLNTALNNDQFFLYQQKIVPTNPGAGEFLHYEVLLRIKDEHGRLISPGAFLPPAERYGLIHRIDHWVIKNTLKWLHEHPNVLAKTKLCSINLSGVSLSDENLSSYVTRHLKQYAIDCNKICFEITESSAIQNLALAFEFIQNMHELGCSFSLDDFGTGMSSFSYLKQLPVNHLKIDGSFIRHIDTDPIDLAMTRSINEIGHVMGMSTMAEFVESEEIFQLLRQLGVDYAQGYHIAKPAPLNELLNHLD
jgi:diguanylate cyclase (GGDEF)-like protein/PAS domain S-box-containing protein